MPLPTTYPDASMSMVLNILRGAGAGLAPADVAAAVYDVEGWVLGQYFSSLPPLPPVPPTPPVQAKRVNREHLAGALEAHCASLKGGTKGSFDWQALLTELLAILSSLFGPTPVPVPPAPTP
jgi:hypothetical protein